MCSEDNRHPASLSIGQHAKNVQNRTPPPIEPRLPSIMPILFRTRYIGKEILMELLIELLTQDYGEDVAKRMIEGYVPKKTSLRVNTLNASPSDIKLKLRHEGIKFSEVPWYKDALVIEDEDENEDKIRNLSIYKNGEIYFQNLSSMIPPLVLEPKPDENILDMTAAPGGKTTQIAALSNNEANITACEKNQIRFERLKYNLEKQGASRVNVINQDARKLDSYFSFDKILLDSPCSGSGTISAISKDFTSELIERSVKVQEELVKKASEIVKIGGEIVYSTCSILKRENEEALNRLLKNKNFEIVPIDKEVFVGVPMLPSQIEGTICVMPTDEYEGFFVAKIRRKL